MRNRCQFTVGLPQGAQQTFRINRMYRCKVCFVERQQQGILVNVQQVFVGRHQQRDLFKRRLSQDQTVVKFAFGKEALMDQDSDELVANCLRRGIQIKGADTPSGQIIERGPRQFSFCLTVATGQDNVQLQESCRWQNQRVALPLKSLKKIVRKFFLRGEIEDEVSVERYLLLWHRHKSSPTPR